MYHIHTYEWCQRVFHRVLAPVRRILYTGHKFVAKKVTTSVPVQPESTCTASRGPQAITFIPFCFLKDTAFFRKKEDLNLFGETSQIVLSPSQHHLSLSSLMTSAFLPQRSLNSLKCRGSHERGVQHRCFLTRLKYKDTA